MSQPRTPRRADSARYINLIVGENIAKHRLRQSLTQREMARVFGAEESYFRAVEKGHKQMSLLRVVEIADALGVPTVELLEGL